LCYELAPRVEVTFIRSAVIAVLSVTLSLPLGCSSESPSASVPTDFDAGADASSPPREASVRAACLSARSAEKIPARSVAMSADVQSGPQVFYVQELFGLFKANCGGCHVENRLGTFQVKSAAEFPTLVTQKVVDRIFSDDDAKRMPPGSKPIAVRPAGDPVIKMGQLIRLWLDQDSPSDSFTVPREESDAGALSRYVMSPEAGNGLTNIGSCVATAPLVGTAQATMAPLDARFAGLQRLPPGVGSLAERVGLPETLDQTDLFTFDTEELARNRVIAYAPTYPLWSEGAHKLRHVRVPLAQSIEFDADKQTFRIPDNTRFYKTFLKAIRQNDGSVRWRKVETRLIVARADTTLPDGTHQSNALFGTYEWNEVETQATLLTLPYRNQEPFTDHLFPIVVDEIKQQEVLDTDPPKPSDALVKAEAMRHYAVPGAERCRQCHMGSPTQNFVLGFFPLQVHRRPAGEAGVIEPAGPDELTQLQRLIDYGVITGMKSPDEIVPLEASQGSRKPRNELELKAQAYLLGNCAHCHNPRGFPTVNNPMLAELLDFLPSATGGIFQFELTKVSPRITRGDDGAVPIPYITPSLFDYPPGGSPSDIFLKGMSISDPKVPYRSVLAPWRSLIYRNVDTPFSYADDFALFPHMPVNVPGFDCRAPRILGDWMVSIPARRKNPEPVEEFLCTRNDDDLTRCDLNPQPYEEVRPGEADYEQAVRTAQSRLVQYHHGAIAGTGQVPATSPVPKYQGCLDTSDIVDPKVTGADPYTRTPADGPMIDEKGEILIQRGDGVPDHAHWVVTDISEVPGPWNPRRPDWNTILVNHDFGKRPPASRTDLVSQWELTRKVASVLSPPDGSAGVVLADVIEPFATKELALGLWEESSHPCGASAPTVASLSESERPRWLKDTPVPGDRHVYKELPGAAVFGMICINCHGPNFDSRGRQADQLMMMTGGLARVANFRDGLFGEGGQNRERVFGPYASPAGGPSANDWAARYMVWMALGGTNAGIPKPILNVVNQTRVLGIARPRPIYVGSANMLDGPRQFCAATLPRIGQDAQATATELRFDVRRGGFELTEKGTPLIMANGDAELWLRLCSIHNPPPVRALVVLTGEVVRTSTRQFYPQSSYPSTERVGDHNGSVRRGVQPDNLLPWCIANTPAGIAYAQNHPIGDPPEPLPVCPADLGAPLTEEDQENWATRGAMNAGLSVFIYLDRATRGITTPPPPYDRCDLLP